MTQSEHTKLNTWLVLGAFDAGSADESRAASLGMNLEIGALEYLGEGAYRTMCKVCGIQAKRITQIKYGHQVGSGPVWMLNGSMVNDWFAELLESKYQKAIKEKIQIIQ